MATAETSPEIGNYSPDMERLLSRSASINEYYEEDFDISFTSLFLAFLVSDDLVSQWFHNYVKQAGINVNAILEEHGLDRRIMDDIAGEAPPRRQGRLRMTSSARRFLQTADQLRQKLADAGEGQPLDVLHLMAVFIYSPWVHEKDLVRWGFNRVDWSNEFLKLMSSLQRRKMAFWRDLHLVTFGEEPVIQS
jgi:hypothetical protein